MPLPAPVTRAIFRCAFIQRSPYHRSADGLAGWSWAGPRWRDRARMPTRVRAVPWLTVAISRRPWRTAKAGRLAELARHSQAISAEPTSMLRRKTPRPSHAVQINPTGRGGQRTLGSREFWEERSGPADLLAKVVKNFPPPGFPTRTGSETQRPQARGTGSQWLGVDLAAMAASRREKPRAKAQPAAVPRKVTRLERTRRRSGR